MGRCLLLHRLSCLLHLKPGDGVSSQAIGKLCIPNAWDRRRGKVGRADPVGIDPLKLLSFLSAPAWGHHLLRVPSSLPAPCNPQLLPSPAAALLLCKSHCRAFEQALARCISKRRSSCSALCLWFVRIKPEIDQERAAGWRAVLPGAFQFWFPSSRLWLLESCTRGLAACLSF